MTCQSPPLRVFTFALCVAAALSTLLVSVVLAPAPAQALTNPERTYEQVSPVYKAGYGVTGIVAVAPDGESVAFAAKGGFAGALTGDPTFANRYVARRGPSGWSTASLQPPFGGVVDFSENFEYVLASSPLGPNSGTEEFAASEQEVLLHRTDAPETAENWEVDGGLVLKRLDGGTVTGIEEGASGDLCHVVFSGFEGPLLPEAVNANGPMYDVARGCGGEPPSLRLVALNNDHPAALINPQCKAELGSAVSQVEPQGKFNAIAAGGSEMFFSVAPTPGASCFSGVAQQLFVRLGASRTLEVSKSLAEAESCGETIPCPGAAARAAANFKGANEQGTEVFFTTRQSLVAEDKDAANDLYMATIGCSASEAGCEVARRGVTSLVQVSHDPHSGEASEVQGVVRIAPDGSRVYFVARGVLGEGANGEGQAPVRGADNLYVYEPDPEHEGQSKTVFIADLCSGSGLSGVVEDLRCPRYLKGEDKSDESLWNNTAAEAQTAGPNGRFLVFSTYAQLLAGDTDNAKDVYRYDSQTGALERVSLGEAGYDANGNSNDTSEVGHGANLGNGDAVIPVSEGTFDKVSEQQEMRTRAISEDGSRIVFRSAAPLSPDVSNGRLNIYEWHEGSVSLISSGSSEGNDEYPVISPSGQDIFFTTVQGLVSQDTDGLADVYDARLEGGFPPPSAPRQECSGDACQGPLTNPSPLLVPGSVSQAPGENFAAPSAPVVSVKKATVKRKKKRKQKVKKRGNAGAKKSSRRSGR